jgi:hypothetical protein
MQLKAQIAHLPTGSPWLGAHQKWVDFAFLGFLPSHDYPFPPTYNIPIAKMQISMSEVILSKKNF